MTQKVYHHDFEGPIHQGPAAIVNWVTMDSSIWVSEKGNGKYIATPYTLDT